MLSSPVHRVFRYQEHVELLRQACDWLGITQGRAAEYDRLITELFTQDSHTPEQILAYNESCEIVDLFKYWSPDATQFPGMRQRLRQVCRKGPVLREGECPRTNNNRPRNDAFVYLLSGLLLRAGVCVVGVDGIHHKDRRVDTLADVTLDWDATYIDIECKRPQAVAGLVPRMREARSQLEDATRQSRDGIVAIDCSVMTRPAGTLLEYEAGPKGEARLSQDLESHSTALVPYFTSNILGTILFARVGGMARIAKPPTTGISGEYSSELRPETIQTWLFVNNSAASQLDVFRGIAMLVDARRAEAGQ